MNASHISSLTTFLKLELPLLAVAGGLSVEIALGGAGDGGIGGCSAGGAFFPNKLSRRARLPRVFDRVSFGVAGSGVSLVVGAVDFAWAGVSLPPVGLVDEIELAFVDRSSSSLLLESSRLLGEGDRDRRGVLFHRCETAPDDLASTDGSLPSEAAAAAAAAAAAGLPRSYEVPLQPSEANGDLTAKVDTVIFGVLGVVDAAAILACEQASGGRVECSTISAGIGETDIVVVAMLDFDGESGKEVLSRGSLWVSSFAATVAGEGGWSRPEGGFEAELLRRRIDNAGASECRREKAAAGRAFSCGLAAIVCVTRTGLRVQLSGA